MKFIKKNLNLFSLKRWIRNKPVDFIVTMFLMLLILWVATLIVSWFILEANWNVVSDNLDLYAIGSYPADQKWRPMIWMLSLSTLTIITLTWRRKGILQKSLPWIWILMLPSGLVLMAGGPGLIPVASHKWGGLALTLILALSSAFIAMPLGILLALGRRSKLAIIKYSCGIYIDSMRSVPLIAILFFGQLLIPLFLPVEFDINRVVRAILAFAVFAAAYVAEDVRGGLQAIPKTQVEAAEALGLNPKQIAILIMLPQALRTAIPALTNQAIGLLQNTSLMAILGLVELLGISRSLLANPNFMGRYLEVYVWIAAVYWLICTSMALLARRLEQELDPNILTIKSNEISN